MCTHTHMLPSREIIFRPNRNKNKEGRAAAAAALGHIVSVPLSAGSNEAVNTVFPCSPLSAQHKASSVQICIQT